MVNWKQVIFSIILPGTVCILFPLLLLWIFDKQPFLPIPSQIPVFFILGILVMALGIALWFDCILIFYKIGKGTLMPLSKIETKKLVIAGPYKYVRNPMIIGVIITIIGEGLLFLSASILIYTAFVFFLNLIYIPLKEEKGLEARFGSEYLNYKKQVRGWIPRFHSYSAEE